MRVSLDRQHVLGVSSLEDVGDDPSRKRHVRLVIVLERVVHACERKAILVGLIGEGDAIVLVRKQLVEYPNGGPVVVVTHIFSKSPAPVTGSEHMFGPAD